MIYLIFFFYIILIKETATLSLQKKNWDCGASWANKKKWININNE